MTKFAEILILEHGDSGPQPTSPLVSCSCPCTLTSSHHLLPQQTRLIFACVVLWAQKAFLYLCAQKIPIDTTKLNSSIPFSVKSSLLLEPHFLIHHLHALTCTLTHGMNPQPLSQDLAWYFTPLLQHSILQSLQCHTVLPSQLVISFFLHLTVNSLKIKIIHPDPALTQTGHIVCAQ